MKDDRAVQRRLFHYAQADIALLYKEFHILSDGYTDKQAAKSRERYGGNNPSERSGDTVFHGLRQSFINPFSVILFILAIISFITDVLLASNFSRNMTTVLIILSMLLISGIVRFIQEMRSKRIAKHLTSLFYSNAAVRRNGKWVEISSSHLVVGDTVRLFPGGRVPADIRLTKTNRLFVSQSVITGESAVLEKNSQKLSSTEPLSFSEYNNIVFTGSTVISGTGEGIVLAVGKDTVYGGLAGIKSGRKNKFDQGANSIARVLIHFMTVLIPIVFIACGLTQNNWFSAFLFALSVAVGLTPEMLPMVINACLVKGIAAMSRKQTVVKNINAMQCFGSMDVLCVDKTGTLTNDMIWLEYYTDILGNENEKVLDFAYLSSLYHAGIRNHLDNAILKYREMPGHQHHFAELEKKYPRLDELPFDYERKYTSVLVKNDNRNLLIVKGSIDEVCRYCNHVEYKGKRLAVNCNSFADVHAVVDEMLEDGMKVLAVAYKELPPNQKRIDNEQNLTLLGYLAFFDAPKQTAADAIKKLKSLQVKIRVLTGDHKSVAVSICKRLGIDTEHVLTGKQLEKMTDDERAVRIEYTSVFAELSPRQKTELVRTLQENSHTVGFLGDGMNDLPAMVEADVGISIDTAAEAVKECADVILLKKDLNVLEEGILEGRKAFSNMSKYIKITASSNFGNIFSIVLASVFLPFFPITSIQLLLLNLLYDMICLVLPWDHVDKEAYSRPLAWSGRTLGRFMRFFGPISSIFDILTFLFLFFILCPMLCGGSYIHLAEDMQIKFIALFQTGWFLESMWSQVLILHLLRTKKIPLLQSKPSLPVMLVTTSGILFFTILTFTPLGQLIGLTALPPVYFCFLIVIVTSYLLLITLAKSLYIKKYHELL